MGHELDFVYFVNCRGGLCYTVRDRERYTVREGAPVMGVRNTGCGDIRREECYTVRSTDSGVSSLASLSVSLVPPDVLTTHCLPLSFPHPYQAKPRATTGTKVVTHVMLHLPHTWGHSPSLPTLNLYPLPGGNSTPTSEHSPLIPTWGHFPLIPSPKDIHSPFTSIWGLPLE